MAHAMDYARRLLRELPRNPEKLLRSRSYADPTFLRLFFEWLDERIYRDPQAGLKWAKVAPELALKTPEEDGPEGGKAHRSLGVQAWVILGGAYRACGRPDDAEAPFKEALELIQHEPVSELVKADTERRLSFLRACQGRPGEALDLAIRAVVAMRAIPGAPLGGVLVAKGYVLASEFGRYAEAIDAFGEALLLAGNTRSSAARKRLHETATKNLAAALAESGKLRNQRTALLFIRQAHRFLRGQARCQEPAQSGSESLSVSSPATARFPSLQPAGTAASCASQHNE
jgi:tetratricopeptide (TPR) repeat protein